MAQLENPSSIGGKLLEFAEGGVILLILSRKICHSHEYECDADDCDGCPGIEILGHLENQIEYAGVKYMKDLLEEWGRD